MPLQVCKCANHYFVSIVVLASKGMQVQCQQWHDKWNWDKPIQEVTFLHKYSNRVLSALGTIIWQTISLSHNAYSRMFYTAEVYTRTCFTLLRSLIREEWHHTLCTGSTCNIEFTYRITDTFSFLQSFILGLLLYTDLHSLRQTTFCTCKKELKKTCWPP